MTKFGRISWFAAFVVAALLPPGKGAAQNAVTPTLAPLPPGQLITVNNAPGGAHFDPHVSGDLVAYSNLDVSGCQSIHYFNLASLSDASVPVPCGSQLDFLSDVRGSVIAFTDADASHSAIFTFDSANPGAPPVELAPQAGSFREEAQIGDSTIAWRDFGFINNGVASDIAAYDRASGTVTRLTSDGQLNFATAISPDGKVITWMDCQTFSACDIWSATGGSGNWTLHQLTNGNNGGGVCRRPDSDGQIVVYSCNRSGQDSIFWQPAAGGTELVLSFAGSSILPAVSGGLISFANAASGATNHNIFVFDTSTTKLYQVTNALDDTLLNDISFTADGKVRVVWEVDQAAVLAYTFNLPVGDFNLGAIAPATISAGSFGSTNVTVNPLNGFSSPVNLSVSGPPAGVTATFSVNPVTPSGGNPATSVLNVSVADSVTPASLVLMVTGTAGSESHSANANITVTATTAGTGNLIGDLVAHGCIDAGVGNALLSKLSAAQSAGDIQTEINILSALKNQITAQAGKHIATSCNLAGVTINPVTVLLLDVQALIDSLRVSLAADPITGYVVDMNGAGVPGATLSVTGANGIVATAVTDITGFYFIATTGNVLAVNANYSLTVAGLPTGFSTAAPASQPFVWQGTAIGFSDFVVN